MQTYNKKEEGRNSPEPVSPPPVQLSDHSLSSPSTHSPHHSPPLPIMQSSHLLHQLEDQVHKEEKGLSSSSSPVKSNSPPNTPKPVPPPPAQSSDHSLLSPSTHSPHHSPPLPITQISPPLYQLEDQLQKKEEKDLNFPSPINSRTQRSHSDPIKSHSSASSPLPQLKGQIPKEEEKDPHSLPSTPENTTHQSPHSDLVEDGISSVNLEIDKSQEERDPKLSEQLSETPRLSSSHSESEKSTTPPHSPTQEPTTPIQSPLSVKNLTPVASPGGANFSGTESVDWLVAGKDHQSPEKLSEAPKNSSSKERLTPTSSPTLGSITPIQSPYSETSLTPVDSPGGKFSTGNIIDWQQAGKIHESPEKPKVTPKKLFADTINSDPEDATPPASPTTPVHSPSFSGSLTPVHSPFSGNLSTAANVDWQQAAKFHQSVESSCDVPQQSLEIIIDSEGDRTPTDSPSIHPVTPIHSPNLSGSLTPIHSPGAENFSISQPFDWQQAAKFHQSPRQERLPADGEEKGHISD